MYTQIGINYFSQYLLLVDPNKEFDGLNPTMGPAVKPKKGC